MGVLFAIGALLAGPFAGSAAAVPFVNANAGEGIVSTDDAVGSNMEALGRRDTADAHGGKA